jgi:hypothetical protein
LKERTSVCTEPETVFKPNVQIRFSRTNNENRQPETQPETQQEDLMKLKIALSALAAVGMMATGFGAQGSTPVAVQDLTLIGEQGSAVQHRLASVDDQNDPNFRPYGRPGYRPGYGGGYGRPGYRPGYGRPGYRPGYGRPGYRPGYGRPGYRPGYRWTPAAAPQNIQSMPAPSVQLDK